MMLNVGVSEFSRSRDINLISASAVDFGHHAEEVIHTGVLSHIRFVFPGTRINIEI